MGKFRIYVLTKQKLNILHGMESMHATNNSKRSFCNRRYVDLRRCNKCKVLFKLGDVVASKQTKSKRIYHYKCAKQVNIC